MGLRAESDKRTPVSAKRVLEWSVLGIFLIADGVKPILKVIVYLGKAEGDGGGQGANFNISRKGQQEVGRS
jgi:hypothetical protein